MSDKDIAAAAAGRPEDEMLPPAKLLGFGTQHILSMFGGVIAVPFIVGGAAHLSPAQIGVLVSSALFVSGLATILQTLGIPYIGAKLPLVQGISFASVSTMVTIVANHGAGTQGLRVVFGAVVAAAAFGFLIAPVFSKLVRYFPPVVTGSVITVIGISLMPAATGWVSAQRILLPSAPSPWPVSAWPWYSCSARRPKSRGSPSCWH